MRKYISYDIFDTCFVRSCGRPEAVFDILAKCVLGEQTEMSLRMDFAQERIIGEQKARKHLIDGSNEDITLDEIYNFCDFSPYTALSKEQIKHLELDVEKKVLCPVSYVRSQIIEQRKNNAVILFVSDMYLPESFILQLLIDNNFFEEGDSLFVSSTIKKRKSTGHLFEFISKFQSIKYKDWTHNGDNAYSDIRIPKRYGIKTNLINHKYTSYEYLMLDREYSCSQFDIIQTASISRASRLMYPDSPFVTIAADFIAPIYVPFVVSVLVDANRRGIQHLYFLARDSYVFYLIAKEMQSYFPNISIHYLYVSRKSLYLPGLDEVSEKSLKEFFSTIPVHSVNDILDWLQISEYVASKQLLEEKDIQVIIRDLVADVDFSRRVKNKQNEQRSLCIRYFEEQGLTRDNCAIVDLRGHRKCQSVINKLLASRGFHEVFGFYFEVSDMRMKGKGYSSLYYRERFRYNVLNTCLDPCDLFEQYFSMTTQKRTIGYRLQNNMVYPCFDAVIDNLDKLEIISSINQMVCVNFLKKFILQVDWDSAVKICNTSVSVYNVFSNAPQKGYLKAFEGLSFSDSKLFSTPILSHNTDILKSMQGRNWTNANRVYNSRIPWITRAYLYFRIYGRQIYKVIVGR